MNEAWMGHLHQVHSNLNAYIPFFLISRQLELVHSIPLFV